MLRLVTLNAMSSYLMGAIGFSVQLIKRDFELSRVIASWHNIGYAAAYGVILIVLVFSTYLFAKLNREITI